MSTEFKEQGGAATMDPSPLRRWLVSRVMSRVSSEKQLQKRRAAEEKKRVASGRGHEVEYFHQVDDGYSHLSAQILEQLVQRYSVDLKCHLVSGPSGKNAPEPELLLQLSRSDARLIAPQYKLEAPAADAPPNAAAVKQASAILANLPDAQFTQHAARIGHVLWQGDGASLDALQHELGRASDAQLDARVQAGTARRRTLGHYSGAMFYCAGEWYWGVDRLYHLEQRLAALGLDRHPEEPPICPRPETALGPHRDDGSLTLEIYPSLRSPYTAISFDRAVSLAKATGVTLAVRPVLPMVMRGAPITRDKGMYIFTDTAREARAAGVPYGNFYDPIGEPVRKAYSLYPWACSQGRGTQLISAFLRCAFALGVNTNSTRGLRKVVTMAGLDWAAAQTQFGDTSWEAQVEANRLAMYDAGLWGVPSFRLLGPDNTELLALWGQDRLWVIAREIQRHLANRQSAG